MKINKIKLENIRSYTEQEVQFPEGSILLSGDIGAGKTTILLGIEFALFGLQPGKKGTYLLKNNEDNGRVILSFEVEGKEIEIERTLKRNSKSVNQDYCAITINGVKEETSVTELKNKVLEILNYPSEFAKKQNLLYKFTVYTPQEEMKQIILQDPESRVNTIRHVFGIDKYKKILENSMIVASKLREERRIRESQVSNLSEDKKELEEYKQELKEKQSSLEKAGREIKNKKETKENVEKELEELSKKIEEKNKYQQEVEKSKIMVSNKKETISENSKIIEQLKIQIENIEKMNFDEKEILQLQEKIKKIKEKQLELNEKNVKIASKINSLENKNQENENTKNKISKIEICPTCLQDVDFVYKTNIVNKMDKNISDNVKEIQSLEMEKIQNSKERDKIEFEINETQEKIQEKKILKVKVEGLQEKINNKEKLEKQNNSLNKDIEMLKQQINSLQNSIFELKKYEQTHKNKKEELNEKIREERKAEIMLAELKKEIDFSQRQISNLKERIQKTEQIIRELKHISELENWVSNKFTPVISHMEKNVMLKLKAEFSELFSTWFNMLVADSFNVSLDENFSPVIEQKDFQLDYEYLSGGERTAIALAYRLALNQVINSFLSKIKTKDIVILDEPTDGFSENQLDKMRDVLQELNVKQLIIVSHEQKMENFVQHAVKFKKEASESKIE